MKFKAFEGEWHTVMVCSFIALISVTSSMQPPSTPAVEWLINTPLLIWFIFSWAKSHEETKSAHFREYRELNKLYEEVLEHAQKHKKKLPLKKYRGYFILYDFQRYAVYEDEQCKGKPIVAFRRTLNNGKPGMFGAKQEIDFLVKEKLAEVRKHQTLIEQPKSD